MNNPKLPATQSATRLLRQAAYLFLGIAFALNPAFASAIALQSPFSSQPNWPLTLIQQAQAAIKGIANSSSATQARGTNVQAKNITIAATEGDLSASGAKLQATDINLEAAKNVNLSAATNTSTIQSSNDSSSVGAGVTFGMGSQSGISFQLSAGQANGKANGSETTHDNTLVTATNSLTVKSGADTNLIGAQLAGDKVKVDVGGNLNIATLQDKSDFKSEQSSSGFSVSVCVPPLCVGSSSASVNIASQSVDHNYQSATGQSGIAAGNGGFDVTVKGNTDLKGAAITSTASADKNSLTTASLTSTDLQNQQSTNSQSSSIGLGYGGGSALATLAQNGASNLLGNLGSGAGLPQNGSQSSTTQSVISAGNIQITGTGDAAKDANSATQVASLTSRDASKANQSLTNTLTLQQAQDIPRQQQTAQENAQAANMVGAVIANGIGDIKQNAKDSQGNKLFPEGSTGAAVLHGLGGIAQAAIGGTNLASGFAAGFVNETVVGQMDAYIRTNCTDCTYIDKNGQQQLTKNGKDLLIAGSQLLGAGVGAVAGGNASSAAAGGNIAGNATAYNRLLHPDQRALLKDQTAGDKDKDKYERELAVLCVLQNCAIDGVSGNTGDSEAKSLMAQGLALQKDNPQLFALTQQAVQDSGALSGQFSYRTLGVDSLKDQTGIVKDVGAATTLIVAAPLVKTAADVYTAAGGQGLSGEKIQDDMFGAANAKLDSNPAAFVATGTVKVLSGAGQIPAQAIDTVTRGAATLVGTTTGYDLPVTSISSAAKDFDSGKISQAGLFVQAAEQTAMVYPPIAAGVGSFEATTGYLADDNERVFVGVATVGLAGLAAKATDAPATSRITEVVPARASSDPATVAPSALQPNGTQNLVYDPVAKVYVPEAATPSTAVSQTGGPAGGNNNTVATPVGANGSTGAGAAADASTAVVDVAAAPKGAVLVPASGGTPAITKGGTVELFTDASGAKVPGAVPVGPTTPNAVGTNATSMPNIPSGSQAQVVANNPFIPPSAGGTGSMMDYLPEAARITQSGGEIVINGNGRNPYFTSVPTQAQLDALGLKITYQGPLLPQYQGMTFVTTQGNKINPSGMQTIVFGKK